MFSGSGNQLATRRVRGGSVAARQFFEALWRWSNGRGCRDLKTSTY
jgi:hypothetical protein